MLDEVGDDEEVARIGHALDDAELESESRAIILVGEPFRRSSLRREPQGEPLARLAVELGILVGSARPLAAEARQHRLRHARTKAATQRDLDRIPQGLGQIGEDPHHLGARLEPVLGRDVAPLIVGDEPPIGDGEQRVMRFVIVAQGEKGLVRGDDRQAAPIGEIEEHGLGRALGRKRMALDLDIEPVPKGACQAIETRSRKVEPPLGDRLVDRPVGAARQSDQPLAQRLDRVDAQMRPAAIGSIDERAARDAHQIGVTLGGRREEHDRRQLPARLTLPLGIAELERELQAHDRLNAFARELLGEFERAVEVVGVGQRQCRHLVGARKLGELGDRQRPLEQRVGGVHMQMHEADIVERHRGLQRRSRETSLSAPRIGCSHLIGQLRATPDAGSRHEFDPRWPPRTRPGSQARGRDGPHADHCQKSAQSGNLDNVFHKHPSHHSLLISSPRDPLMFYLCSSKMSTVFVDFSQIRFRDRLHHES